MKKLFLIFTVIGFFGCAILLFSPSALYAGGQTHTCDTRYPIILAHGTGGADRILGIVDYWWGIPEALENQGAEVYVTRVDGLGGTAEKAAQFKEEVQYIQSFSSSPKFNIIAHSHGALYARYAISNLGLADDVVSLTSIAGPHQGMVLADLIVENYPAPLKSLTTESLNFIYAYFFGDIAPDSCANVVDVTTQYMQTVFNKHTENVSGVIYQSWAARVKTGCPTLVLNPVWRLLSEKEGPNDGLVGVESAKLGDYRGEEAAAWWSPGCDHLNIIGHLFGITPGFYAADFYVDIVADLKRQEL